MNTVFSKTRVIPRRVASLCFAIVFGFSLHGAEILEAAQAPPREATCKCASDCACRTPAKDCNCSDPELAMKARCGCGGSGHQHEGTAPSWDTMFAQSYILGAPALISSPAPGPDDPQKRRLPFEHEHPPRTLP